MRLNWWDNGLVFTECISHVEMGIRYVWSSSLLCAEEARHGSIFSLSISSVRCAVVEDGLTFKTDLRPSFTEIRALRTSDPLWNPICNLCPSLRLAQSRLVWLSLVKVGECAVCTVAEDTNFVVVRMTLKKENEGRGRRTGPVDRRRAGSSMTLGLVR